MKVVTKNKVDKLIRPCVRSYVIPWLYSPMTIKLQNSTIIIINLFDLLKILLIN